MPAPVFGQSRARPAFALLTYFQRVLRALIEAGCRSLALREPGFVARRWPAGQPRAQQWLGLARLAGSQIGEDQRVLEDLALCVTSANPGQVGERRFEQPRGLGVCAAGERGCAGTQRGRNIARREAAVPGEVMQPTDPPLHEFV